MPCTTILVGKLASYDGSTMIARNDDSGAGSFTPKKFVVIHPEDQPRHYKSVISHVEIDLPDNPMRYSAVPNALKGEGVWGAAGVNAANVAITATETITSNERVLGADPLVVYKPAEKEDFLNDAMGSGDIATKKEEKKSAKAAKKEGKRAQSLKKSAKKEEVVSEELAETPGGIGEEDIVTLVLPYIHSAREGVERLGSLLEKYGTYEMNGIAFSDVNEIWWLETIGGHHWIAKRVPDDAYVMMPNQFGIQLFDLADALGAAENHMCSKDLKEFIEKNHLDLYNPVDYYGIDEEEESDEAKEAYDGLIDARLAFGSHDDADHVYNTPRAWYMGRYFNPNTFKWEGADADYRPDSDDIPWCLVPEKKITVEDVKYILSSHFQGTQYDPYAKYGRGGMTGAYRSIGVNRTDFMALLQLRPYAAEGFRAVEWICFCSNVFNAAVPFYPNVDKMPEYLSNTGKEVSTDNFYWNCKLIAALADASYGKSLNHIERYQLAVQSKGHEIINKYDAILAEKFGIDKKSRSSKVKKNSKIEKLSTIVENGPSEITQLLERANEEMAAVLKEKTAELLNKVLFEASNGMKNQYARSDA